MSLYHVHVIPTDPDVRVRREMRMRLGLEIESVLNGEFLHGFDLVSHTVTCDGDLILITKRGQLSADQAIRSICVSVALKNVCEPPTSRYHVHVIPTDPDVRLPDARMRLGLEIESVLNGESSQGFHLVSHAVTCDGNLILVSKWEANNAG